MARILIFDSGLGGLSILQHAREALPGVGILYLADNARFPYGELDADELVSGCVAQIKQVKQRYDVDLVVIACNSASTLVLEPLRAAIDCPVVGVVPAIKPAAEISSNQVIGLLATPGTVQRPYTDQLAGDFASHCDIIRVGSSELVWMAERKLAGEPVSYETLGQILSPFIQALPQPDVVVLGCTHFPLVRNEIAAVLGSGVRLVDSGEAIARRVSHLLPAARYHQGGSMLYLHTGPSPTPDQNQFLKQMGFAEIQDWC